MRRCLAAGVLFFCAGAGSGEAAAQNYGAIAYSPSTKAYGWSYDYPSRGAAESAAVGQLWQAGQRLHRAALVPQCLRRSGHRLQWLRHGVGQPTQQCRKPGAGSVSAPHHGLRRQAMGLHHALTAPPGSGFVVQHNNYAPSSTACSCSSSTRQG